MSGSDRWDFLGADRDIEEGRGDDDATHRTRG